MGGINSGTWYRWNKKTTLEETRRIDINYLRKLELLKSGFVRSLVWTRGGEKSGNIQVHGGEREIRLEYRFRPFGGEWERVSQRIAITYTQCNYGGARPWFLCSGCGRRVGVLSGYGKYFLCRHCYELPHVSKNETEYDRALRKRNKLRDRICDEYDRPVRPKGMHERTFNKLRAEWIEIEERCERYL